MPTLTLTPTLTTPLSRGRPRLLRPKWRLRRGSEGKRLLGCGRCACYTLLLAVRNSNALTTNLVYAKFCVECQLLSFDFELACTLLAALPRCIRLMAGVGRARSAMVAQIRALEAQAHSATISHANVDSEGTPNGFNSLRDTRFL